MIPRFAGKPATRAATVLLCLATAGGCLQPAAERRPGPAPGEPRFASPEEAAREFLSALAAGDAERIRSLALSETEFAEAVYPMLPASRPERNTSAEFLWNLTAPRSRNSLARVLERHGGRRLELLALDFLGGTTDYGPFSVHRETALTVRAEDGEERVVRLFGSMIERDGSFRIYSFVVD